MTKEDDKTDNKRKFIKPKRKLNYNSDDDKEIVVKSSPETVKTEIQLNYKQTSVIKESHSNSIFGIATNEHVRRSHTDEFIVVSVGGPYVTFYESSLNKSSSNNMRFLHAYKDADPDEEFYCCAWSYYVPNQSRGDDYFSGTSESFTTNCVAGLQIVACAGKRGVIRILSPNMGGAIFNLVGHGQSVNEVRFHPKYPDLLFTFSKDYSIRLWNVWNNVLVCVFGGSEGHRSEILHGDIDMSGNFLLSCGMDHTVKIWKLDHDRLQQAITRSRKYTSHENDLVFDTFLQHFPDFSSNKVHGNYIDCGRWFGRLIFSKSCEGYLVLWKPGSLDSSLTPQFKIGQDIKPSVLHQFELDDCDIWYVRFDINAKQGLLALGNRSGRVYIWNLNDKHVKEDSSIFELQPLELQVNVKNGLAATVRQTRFANDAKILFCACDGGMIVRFDRV